MEGVFIHFEAMISFTNYAHQSFRSCCQIMRCVLSSSFVRWSDLVSSVVAGLISVIVNYGVTFVLTLQAAKTAGLIPSHRPDDHTLRGSSPALPDLGRRTHGFSSSFHHYVDGPSTAGHQRWQSRQRYGPRGA